MEQAQNFKFEIGSVLITDRQYTEKEEAEIWGANSEGVDHDDVDLDVADELNTHPNRIGLFAQCGKTGNEVRCVLASEDGEPSIAAVTISQLYTVAKHASDGYGDLAILV